MIMMMIRTVVVLHRFLLREIWMGTAVVRGREFRTEGGGSGLVQFGLVSFVYVFAWIGAENAK